MMLTSLRPSLTPPAMRPMSSLSPSPFTLNAPAQAKPAYGMSPAMENVWGMLKLVALAIISVVAFAGDSLSSQTLQNIAHIQARSVA